MEDIEFTAIIPAFNEERYVARAIDSVLSQTVRPEQIVVVDDGSTDGTAAVIKQYASDGVTHLYQENGGLASARNAGIRAARGMYIGFLDADDEWKAHLVSDVKRIFAQHPNLVWATAPYERSLENGHIDFVCSVSRDLSKDGVIEDYFEAQTRFHFSCSSDMFVKRAVFEDVGRFDTSISQYGEDLDMWFRIALKNPQIGYSDRAGAVYWRRAGSIMDSDPRNVERQLTRIQKTESHALSIGGAALRQSEPLVLDWIWTQMKEAVVQGNDKVLQHISRYYGRRLPLWRRLLLDVFRAVPLGPLLVAMRKLRARSRGLER